MSRSLPKASMRPEGFASLKVLVVDDNTNVQRLICDVLRAGGVGWVETAADGIKAREMIWRWDPHIVFTDWSMPVMGGLELTRSIRRAAVKPDPRIPNPQVPVIVVTGHRSAADVQNARNCGVNEFVIKPFTPAGLLSRVQMVLMRPRPFVVSADYIGPDRRRRLELSYTGPLRRKVDPEEIVDEAERAAIRETIGVELEALRGLIAHRRGLDRDALKMICRVMEHTSFRAHQLRALAVSRAAMLLMEYVEAMGGHEHCEAGVMEVHFRAIAKLLQVGPEQVEAVAAMVDELETVVRQKIARRRAA